VGKTSSSHSRHPELVSPLVTDVPGSYFGSRNIKALNQVQGDDAVLVG